MYLKMDYEIFNRDFIRLSKKLINEVNTINPDARKNSHRMINSTLRSWCMEKLERGVIRDYDLSVERFGFSWIDIKFKYYRYGDILGCSIMIRRQLRTPSIIRNGLINFFGECIVDEKNKGQKAKVSYLPFK